MRNRCHRPVVLGVLLFQNDKDLALGLASASPLFGIGIFTNEIEFASSGDWPVRVRWAVFWMFVFSDVAMALLAATLATFDACLGRISPRRRPLSDAGRRRIGATARRLVDRDSGTRYHRLQNDTSRPVQEVQP